MSFIAYAQSASNIQNSWVAETPSVPALLTIAIPPEFEGPGGGFSPEDLYVLALENCFVATFKVFAEKSRLEYEKINVHANLTVDRDHEGRPWMARVVLKIELNGVLQKDLAQRLLERVSQNCMILNSVKTEKKFEFQIN